MRFGKAMPSRLTMISAVHTVVRIEEYCFDYLAYPYMLYVGGPAAVNVLFGADAALRWGYWGGLAIMLVASLLLNILYVRLYDRNGPDWFGFERARAWTPSNRVLKAALRGAPQVG